jgi:hypothetical protein
MPKQADEGPRLFLVEHIREQIAQGTYLSQRRIEMTADIILAQIRSGTLESWAKAREPGTRRSVDDGNAATRSAPW